MESSVKREEEIFDLLYLKMLNFFSFRQRSEKEIQERLRKYLSKSHLPLREREVVKNKVLDRLKESGYLSDSNDIKFAQSYVSGISNSNKSSNRKKIFQFLLKKGVSREIIDQSLEDTPKELFLNSALRDAEKKLRLMRDTDEYTRKRKVSDFLYRKGYDGDTISSVVDTLL